MATLSASELRQQLIATYTDLLNESESIFQQHIHDILEQQKETSKQIMHELHDKFQHHIDGVLAEKKQISQKMMHALFEKMQKINNGEHTQKQHNDVKTQTPQQPPAAAVTKDIQDASRSTPQYTDLYDQAQWQPVPQQTALVLQPVPAIALPMLEKTDVEEIETAFIAPETEGTKTTTTDSTTSSIQATLSPINRKRPRSELSGHGDDDDDDDEDVDVDYHVSNLNQQKRQKMTPGNELLDHNHNNMAYHQQLQQQHPSRFAPVSIPDQHGDANIIGVTELAGRNERGLVPPVAKDMNAVFIGDLHFSVTRADLASVFGICGEIVWMQLFDCSKRLDRPFNFAFLYYANQQSVQQCLADLNYTKFYDQPCRVMPKLRDSREKEWTQCNLMVKNLPPNTNSQMLFELFQRYGAIISAKVKTNNSGRALPFGYVQFHHYESAKNAITAAQQRQIVLHNSVISAEWFTSRDVRPNKLVFVKYIPTMWDESRIVRFIEDIIQTKIPSISVKTTAFHKSACVGLSHSQDVPMAIAKLENAATGDYMNPRLNAVKFKKKSERKQHAHNGRDGDRDHRREQNDNSEYSRRESEDYMHREPSFDRYREERYRDYDYRTHKI